MRHPSKTASFELIGIKTINIFQKLFFIQENVVTEEIEQLGGVVEKPVENVGKMPEAEIANDWQF